MIQIVLTHKTNPRGEELLKTIEVWGMEWSVYKVEETRSRTRWREEMKNKINWI